MTLTAKAGRLDDTIQEEEDSPCCRRPLSSRLRSLEEMRQYKKPTFANKKITDVHEINKYDFFYHG